MCVVDYELIDGRYDPADIVTLEYNLELNRFIDLSFGNIIHDIHRLLTPWQIMLFKKEQCDKCFPDVTDTFLVELYWPE